MNTYFSVKLKELRTENGLSQLQLAKILNYTQSNICEWENGKVEPRADALIAISSYFNISIDYLLGRTDDLGATIPTAQDLSRDEWEVLELYDALSPTRKEDLMIFLRALSGNPAESASTTNRKKI